ncbi:hypothetical protein Q455_0216810 [Escherichia coli ATCC BAA-2192]|nr:hypothetical protein Q455_0216810 [Escherichia coli ATCC BAA-2192]
MGMKACQTVLLFFLPFNDKPGIMWLLKPIVAKPKLSI